MALRACDPDRQPERYFNLRAHLPLKLAGTLLFVGVFFVGYFVLLNHPVRPVTVMPSLALDRAIGFHPWTLLLYGSLWFYVPLPPMLLARRRDLFAYAGAAAALAVVGLAVFLFWPTAVPPAEIDWAQYPGFEGLKQLDASGNACPSLHVAFAVFTALALERIFRIMGGRGVMRLINALWCVGIVYSTLATKQHVVLDVLAGVALGVAAMGAWARAEGVRE